MAIKTFLGINLIFLIDLFISYFNLLYKQKPPQKLLKHKQKPPYLVEASFFINTILSHVGQLGRLDCMGCDGV